MGNRLRANDRVFHTIDTVVTFRSIVQGAWRVPDVPDWGQP